MRKIMLTSLFLTIAPALPVDARSHRPTSPAKPPTQATQENKSSADKASADIDKAMERSLRSICRGC